MYYTRSEFFRLSDMAILNTWKLNTYKLRWEVRFGLLRVRIISHWNNFIAMQ